MNIAFGIACIVIIFMWLHIRDLKSDARETAKNVANDWAKQDLEKAALEKQLSDLKTAKKSQFN